MDSAWVERYLGFLGVDGGAPDMTLLAQVAANHKQVPFENVTSLMRRQAAPEGPVPPLDFDALLQTWQAGRGGGVCYEIAGMVLDLLRGLGFDAQPLQGQITFPGSHLAVRVRLEGRDWLIDCGNGAPIREPIPLDQIFEVHRVGLGFRFRSGEDGFWVQDRFINGDWQSFCTYNLTPVDAEQLEAAYQRHHRLPAESFVVQDLRIVKWTGEAFLALWNHDFTRYSADGKQRRRVSGWRDYEALLRDEFGLPGLPIRDGLRSWEAVAGSSVEG